MINANVFLEAEESILGMDFWPPEIRENPDCLAECESHRKIYWSRLAARRDSVLTNLLIFGV